MFKHTGIVRRIDETGRLIIPKELRRKYRIHDGDPIEIGEGENAIILKKYSVLELANETTHKIIQSFSNVTGMPVLLCNVTHVIESARTLSSYKGAELTMELSDCFYDGTNSSHGVQIIHTADVKVGAMERIFVNKIVEGALIIPANDREITEAHKDCLKVCASAIAAIAE